VTSKEPESEKRYTELEVRSLTGAGSEVAVHHWSRVKTTASGRPFRGSPGRCSA